jgi:hypothetical protein
MLAKGPEKLIGEDTAKQGEANNSRRKSNRRQRPPGPLLRLPNEHFGHRPVNCGDYNKT